MLHVDVNAEALDVNAEALDVNAEALDVNAEALYLYRFKFICEVIVISLVWKKNNAGISKKMQGE